MIALFLVLTQALAQMPAQPFHAKADPLFSVGQGQTRELEILLTMEGETKIYVDRVAVEVREAGELTVGELVVPEGEPFLDPFTETDRPVFTKPTTLLLPVTAGEKKGRQELVIDVLWQGCSKSMCYPPWSETLTVPIRVTRKRQ